MIRLLFLAMLALLAGCETTASKPKENIVLQTKIVTVVIRPNPSQLYCPVVEPLNVQDYVKLNSVEAERDFLMGFSQELLTLLGVCRIRQNIELERLNNEATLLEKHHASP